MTCVVGYVEKGNVWMGADSAGVAGYSISTRLDEKVFIKGDMIFGFTCSFRMGQIIRYCLAVPEHSPKKSDYEYLCSDFIDALMKCFKDKGYLEIKDSVHSGGTFLLGYKGTLYRVEGDFQVGKNREEYNACGCGVELALGALHAVRHRKALSPEGKILISLNAAEEFSAGVKKPFNVLCLGKHTQ